MFMVISGCPGTRYCCRSNRGASTQTGHSAGVRIGNRFARMAREHGFEPAQLAICWSRPARYHCSDSSVPRPGPAGEPAARAGHDAPWRSPRVLRRFVPPAAVVPASSTPRRDALEARLNRRQNPAAEPAIEFSGTSGATGTPADLSAADGETTTPM